MQNNPVAGIWKRLREYAGKKSARTRLRTMIALFFIALLNPVRAEIKEYTIVIDPGHGGAPVPRRDDKWDALSRKYLQYYAVGTSVRLRKRRYQEHRLALRLSRRVKHYLDLTRTPSGWKVFRKILRTFSPKINYRRLRFNAVLTRQNGWRSRHLSKKNPRLNDPYRLYDYPHPGDHRHSGLRPGIRPGPEHRNALAPGRISKINALKPHLTLALHLNPAGGRQPGGMAAVLTPAYRTFDMIRKISLRKMSRRRFRKSPWRRLWLVSDRGWSKYDAARSDAWVYFNGYRAKKGVSGPWRKFFRGYRYNMIRWSYADNFGWEKTARKHPPHGPYALKHSNFKARGRFWDRERGLAESWRREGGLKGYGGDNHYASDELMRFVQYGLRLRRPARRKKGAMGKILRPFVSTYSLPTFINSICAYIEIAHINRRRDRTLLTNTRDREATARSLAVGIYSLFAGLKLRKKRYPFRPRGRALNFSKYEKLAGGNYFRRVTD